MELEDAYNVIESIYGFSDETSSAGEAWCVVRKAIDQLRDENERLEQSRFEANSKAELHRNENIILKINNERFRTALEQIASSGPVDKDGNYNPDAAWSWCYDIANSAIGEEE